MGFLSALGFGGGKLDVKLDDKQVTSGGELRGRVTFKGGKREQEVKAITASVSVTTYRTEPGPNGPQRTSQSETIVKGTPISGPFRIQPGGSQDLDFAIPLPSGLYDSEADVEYRLNMSADIDGEVDPGDGEAFTVTGGKRFPKPVVAAAPAPPAPPAPPANAPVAGIPAAGLPSPIPGAVAPGIPGSGLAIGSDVLAQWTDGSWQQARVVGVNGAMVAVDWVDPRLGASTWLQGPQVMAAAPPPPPPPPAPFATPPPAQPAFAPAPYSGHPQAVQQMPAQSFPGQPFSGQPAPVPAQPFPPQPFPGQPMMPMPTPAAAQPPAVGARVLAQWTDGNWYPAAVVQLQGTLVGVDWEDPRLGASTWVQPTQIVQR